MCFEQVGDAVGFVRGVVGALSGSELDACVVLDAGVESFDRESSGDAGRVLDDSRAVGVELDALTWWEDEEQDLDAVGDHWWAEEVSLDSGLWVNEDASFVAFEFFESWGAWDIEQVGDLAIESERDGAGDAEGGVLLSRLNFAEHRFADPAAFAEVALAEFELGASCFDGVAEIHKFILQCEIIRYSD